MNNPFSGFGVYRYRFGLNQQNTNTGLALAPSQSDSLDPQRYSGGIAGSYDWSNWSVWGTPVVSQFKNNIAPNTSNGTVVLGLIGVEYNYDDRLISGLSLAADSTNSNTTYNGGTYKSSGLTVSPYMGRDSVEPFLSHPGKWAIVLGLTSNPGADDFQRMNTPSGPLYVEVMKKVASWGTPDNLMFVVGATQSEHLKTLRTLFPSHFFLIPGIGAQGGSLKTAVFNEPP